MWSTESYAGIQSNWTIYAVNFPTKHGSYIGIVLKLLQEAAQNLVPSKLPVFVEAKKLILVAVYKLIVVHEERFSVRLETILYKWEIAAELVAKVLTCLLNPWELYSRLAHCRHDTDFDQLKI